MRTLHDVKTGMTRLMAAPRDVAPALGHTFGRPEAPAAHEGLFRSYLTDMEEVYEVASEVWESDLDELIEAGLPLDDAIKARIEVSVAGPAAHPSVVWLVRKYWLECHSLGRSLRDTERLRPEVFLLQWLVDDGREDYVQLLTAMPYWPIGLDADGNWC